MVVSTIVRPPACAAAETVDAPATVNESASGPLEAVSYAHVTVPANNEVLSAVIAGATLSSAFAFAPSASTITPVVTSPATSP